MARLDLWTWKEPVAELSISLREEGRSGSCTVFLRCEGGEGSSTHWAELDAFRVRDLSALAVDLLTFVEHEPALATAALPVPERYDLPSIRVSVGVQARAEVLNIACQTLSSRNREKHPGFVRVSVTQFVPDAAEGQPSSCCNVDYVAKLDELAEFGEQLYAEARELIDKLETIEFGNLEP